MQKNIIGIALAGNLFAAPLGHTQDATQEALALKRSGFIEFGVSYERLTGGEKDWAGAFVRVNRPITPNDRLDAEVAYHNRFDRSGLFASVGVTHTFNEDWYGRLAVGSSYHGFFLPKWRVDGSISRKWLPGRNLVTTLGLSHIESKNDRTDLNALASVLYYFEQPFIVELGTRFNRSSPGSVDAQRYFGVLTYGRDKERYLTVKYETGEEAYQLLGGSRTIREFDSDEFTLIWREWLNQDRGFNLRARHYSNPSYDRTGVEFALFLDF